MSKSASRARQEIPSKSDPYFGRGPVKSSAEVGDPLAALTRVVAALKPDSDLILEQKKQLEELNATWVAVCQCSIAMRA